MHQLLCGVDETVVVDGYRVQILEVTKETVTFGLSLPGGEQRLHEIRLPAAGASAPSNTGPRLYSPPAVN